MVRGMDSVHTAIYLLFNEGFQSSDGKAGIRKELCEEALGLMGLLLEEPRVCNQDTLGLVSLMSFHMARIETRVDEEGHYIPLELQDRSLWMSELIAQGEHFGAC